MEENCKKVNLSYSGGTSKGTSGGSAKNTSGGSAKGTAKDSSRGTTTKWGRHMNSVWNQWERLHLSQANCFILSRIYVGMKEFLTPEGIYPANQIKSLAAQFGIRQYRKLIDLICRSKSFTFICHPELTACYGFYSPKTLSESKLKDFQVKYPELNQIPVSAEMTQLLTPKNAEKKIKNFSDAVIYNNYILINCIIPPSEDSLVPSEKEIRDFGPMSDAGADNKPDFGNAQQYFHEMKLDPERSKLFFTSLLQRISGQFNLSLRESKFVLIHLVQDYLIPLFDRNERFRSCPPVGRDRWLQHIIDNRYFTATLQNAYAQAKPEIQADRAGALQRLHQEQRQNRPLSPYEWMDTTTGTRQYEDSQNGLINLPKDAPPRPSAHARWSSYFQQWNEDSNGSCNGNSNCNGNGSCNNIGNSNAIGNSNGGNGTSPGEEQSNEALLAEILNENENEFENENVNENEFKNDIVNKNANENENEFENHNKTESSDVE